MVSSKFGGISSDSASIARGEGSCLQFEASLYLLVATDTWHVFLRLHVLRKEVLVLCVFEFEV